jgi:hypothetical protein
MTGVSPTYVWAVPWPPWITSFFVLCSIVCFSRPLWWRPPNPMLFLPPNTAHNALSIDFLRDDLHEIVQTSPAGTIRRMLKVSTLNQGNGWLSNCRLSVEQTAPSIYDNAVELESAFTLQVGERQYSWFLYFDEKFPDGHATPKVLLAHRSGGFYVEIGFSTTQPTIFALKATSNEARERTTSFRAFVENGHLQMEKL